jgi:hypothetical protein
MLIRRGYLARNASFVSTYATPRLCRQTRPGDTWLEHGSILALLGRATADRESSSSEYGFKF